MAEDPIEPLPVPATPAEIETERTNALVALNAVRHGSLRYLFDIFISVINGSVRNFSSDPDIPVPSLPDADPLTGDEFIEIWQEGDRKKTTVSALGGQIIIPPDPPAPFENSSWALSSLADGSTRIAILNLPADVAAIERQYDDGAWISVGGIVTGNYDAITKTDGEVISVKVRVRNSAGTTTTDAKTTQASANIVHTFKTLFPGQVQWEYDSANIANGPVASFPSTGRVAKTLSNTVAQPVKDANGVKFQAGVTQQLRSQGTEPADELAPHVNRGGCVIFSVNDAATTGTWIVFSVHGTASNVAGQRQPYITVNKASGLIGVSWVNGSNVSFTCTVPLVTGTNYIVWQRMGFRMHIWGNGVKGTVTNEFTAPRFATTGIISMGTNTPVQPFDAWLKYLCTWDGEFTSDEALAAVGLAAHMAGRADLLAVDHTYKAARPKFGDIIARHSRQTYTETEWAAYLTSSTADRYSHRGESTAPDVSTWDDMITSDFTTAGEVPSGRHSGIKALYFAPYWLNRGAFASSDNASAHAGNGGSWPGTVVLDTAADTDGGTGMLSLKILYDSSRGGWNVGEMATVADGGQGRVWDGEYYARTRIRFTGDTQSSGAPWFPAWWGYARKHLFWWADERSEFDNFEGTGKDRRYYDSNYHMHVGNRNDNRVGDPSVGSQSSNPATPHNRVGGYTLIPANGFTPEINTRDGQWHNHEFMIFDGVVSEWIDGKEVFRVDVGPDDYWSQPRYFIWDQAKSSAHGDRTLATNEVLSMDIDCFEIKYPPGRLATVLTGFSARPSLARAGNVLTITPNLSAASDQTDIYWYRDGLPITTAGLNGELTFTVDPVADLGKVIWAGVQPMFVKDQPTMYTNKLTIS